MADNQYNPKDIEQRVQQYWEENQSFKANDDVEKEKFYCLSLFWAQSSIIFTRWISDTPTDLCGANLQGMR